MVVLCYAQVAQKKSINAGFRTVIMRMSSCQVFSNTPGRSKVPLSLVQLV